MNLPVVRRAEADRAAGRLWKARDRLQGAVAAHPADQDVLVLLVVVSAVVGAVTMVAWLV